MNAPDIQRRSGDAQQQFLRLFLASEREVFRTVAAIVPHIDDTRDVVQQSALALWQRFGEYDSSRPFTPWACQFATIVALQWLDKQRRWKAVLDKDLAETLLRRRDEILPEMDARLQLLADCLRRLALEQRRLIDGYYQLQKPAAVLARESGRTVAAVHKALQRIRTTLLACIERAEVGGFRA